jgi:hypothetical protein
MRKLRLCTVALLILALALLVSTPARASDSSKITGEFRRIYGINLVREYSEAGPESKDAGIHAEWASDRDVDSYLKILFEEWKLYPPELVAKTGLKQIVLCKVLRYGSQLRTAIPDFSHHTLYLDVLRGRHSDSYVRKTIHHEYFHLIDLRDDGQLYKDDQWAALNSPGATYGSGGASVQHDRTVGVLNDYLPGFLDKYAATGVEEDKAEMFSNMVVVPEAVDKRASTDPVIREKAAQMKELLSRYCSDMNETFWANARKLRRLKSNSVRPADWVPWQEP